jgi:hypothetical protein
MLPIPGGVLQRRPADRLPDQRRRRVEAQLVEIEQVGLKILVDQVEVDRIGSADHLPLEPAPLDAAGTPFVDMARVLRVLRLDRHDIGADLDLQHANGPAADLVLDCVDEPDDLRGVLEQAAALAKPPVISIATPASTGSRRQRTEQTAGNAAIRMCCIGRPVMGCRA